MLTMLQINLICNISVTYADMETWTSAKLDLTSLSWVWPNDDTVSYGLANSIAYGSYLYLAKITWFYAFLADNGTLQLSSHCESGIVGMDLADDKSTLVQVMAWCRKATSHYLSQCWHGSMSPFRVTKPQWADSNCESDMHVMPEWSTYN